MLSLLQNYIKKISFHKIAKAVIFSFSLLIGLFITITSYLYYIDITDMSWCQDNPFLLLAIFLVACLFMGIISNVITQSKNPRKSNHVLFSVTFVLIMAATAWWIINAQSLAQSDSQILHDIAIRIIQDKDYSMITNKDSYMAICPHQSGILLYFELILRIIPNFNVVPMECLNWLYLALGLISGYFLMRKWFSDERIITCYSLLVFFCLPWFFYVNFAYGEMPSISLMIFTTWMLTKYFEQPKWRYLILALLSTALGVLLRRNLVIFIVAIVLILLTMCIQQFHKGYIFAMVGLILITALSSTLPQKIYELRADDTMGSGIPSSSYIAMGLQETEGISPGWNNGYHTTTFIGNEYNYEIADSLSKQSIRDSLAYMLENPGYACSFFFRKLVPEWCDQNYSCLYSTSQIYYNRTDAAWKIYNGAWTKPILQIMNGYQSVLYTGFLLFCVQAVIRWFKHKRRALFAEYTWQSLWQLVWMVTIIGGFIFCALWEGGSRYTLPYMVCMLPYSAAGITRLFSFKESN